MAGYSLPLYELIEGLSSRECSNKLDKVYALLGLVYPPVQENQKLHVDYNITPDKLYYTVLSHTSKSGHLQTSILKWKKFRMKLRKSLDLLLDENHKNHELIYEITAERRRFAKNSVSTDLIESTPEHIIANLHRICPKVSVQIMELSLGMGLGRYTDGNHNLLHSHKRKTLILGDISR